ncbi:MAG: hypothetical protein ACT6R2_19860 [Blastomonas fulva]|uniref:hypothetical protein n=1 Tax=Blastomonas fulva TaxID=1550728 RepID=UPI0040336371
MVGASDNRGAFRSRFCAIMADHGSELAHARPCEEALHLLSNEGTAQSGPVPGQSSFGDVRLVVVPGIFGECVASKVLPFQDAEAHLRERHGLPSIEWIPVSGRSSSETNARKIAEWLTAHPTRAGQRLILLGYSKGATDLIETIGRYPAAIPRGASIVGVAPVVSGTPIADKGEGLYSALGRLPLPGCKPGDEGGVRSLTRRDRLSWLAAHRLPSTLRYYSLPAFARKAQISSALRPFYAQLASHDERNDGQVLFQDAIIPGSYILAYANADHWAVTLPMREGFSALSGLLNQNAYPRTVLLEAILQTVLEDEPL